MIIKNSHIALLVLSLIFTLGFTSCVDESILFEDTTVFDGKDWQRDSVVSFTFEVKDTTQKSLISSYIKNQNDYQFCNLYLNYAVLDSNKQIVHQDVKDLMLYNPKTGEPLGNEEMFTDSQIGWYALDTLKFKNLGKYTVTLQHHMRDMSSIDQITSVGLQIKAINN
jgi:gliding motility-associated lipoprotein GldH